MEGPPLGAREWDVWHTWTMEELVQGWLKTRHWERNQDADRLAAMQAQAQATAYHMAATITKEGESNLRGLQRWISSMAEQIKELRGPLFPPDIPPLDDELPPDVALMYRGATYMKKRGRLPDGWGTEAIP